MCHLTGGGPPLQQSARSNRLAVLACVRCQGGPLSYLHHWHLLYTRIRQGSHVTACMISCTWFVSMVSLCQPFHFLPTCCWVASWHHSHDVISGPISNHSVADDRRQIDCRWRNYCSLPSYYACRLTLEGRITDCTPSQPFSMSTCPSDRLSVRLSVCCLHANLALHVTYPDDHRSVL